MTVAANGDTLLHDFDVLADAGGERTAEVKVFYDIRLPVTANCISAFRPEAAGRCYPRSRSCQECVDISARFELSRATFRTTPTTAAGGVLTPISRVDRSEAARSRRGYG